MNKRQNYNDRLYGISNEEAKQVIVDSIAEVQTDATSISIFFKNEHISTVAIYGMGQIGKTLYDFLQNRVDVTVEYGIEKLNYDIDENYLIKHLYEERLPKVDAIIVVPFHEFDRISDELYDFIDEDCRVIPANQIFWMETNFKLDFICPGFPRSGTSSLDAILRQNSNICLPNIKEPRFFRDCAQYCRGVGWYAKHYYSTVENKMTSQVVGEINPSLEYRYARRIRDAFGNLKVIIFYRNPIMWLYSHYRLKLKFYNGKIFLEDEYNPSQYPDSLAQGFEACVKEMFEEDETGKVRMKKYSSFSGYNYIEFYDTYVRYFGKENVKVFLFEDFISDKERVCKEIYDFIGVEASEGIDYGKWELPSNFVPTDDIVRQQMYELTCKREYVDAMPEGTCKQQMLEELRVEMGKIQDKLVDNQERPTEYTVELLEKYYTPQKEYIEKVLNRDLSEIWF